MYTKSDTYPAMSLSLFVYSHYACCLGLDVGHGTYVWVMSHVNESWVMSHVNESWVMSHVNESWLIHVWHDSFICDTTGSRSLSKNTRVYFSANVHVVCCIVCCSVCCRCGSVCCSVDIRTYTYARVSHLAPISTLTNPAGSVTLRIYGSLS